jgi:hypothetical protein
MTHETNPRVFRRVIGCVLVYSLEFLRTEEESMDFGVAFVSCFLHSTVGRLRGPVRRASHVTEHVALDEGAEFKKQEAHCIYL